MKGSVLKSMLTLLSTHQTIFAIFQCVLNQHDMIYHDFVGDYITWHVFEQRQFWYKIWFLTSFSIKKFPNALSHTKMALFRKVDFVSAVMTWVINLFILSSNTNVRMTIIIQLLLLINNHFIIKNTMRSLKVSKHV